MRKRTSSAIEHLVLDMKEQGIPQVAIAKALQLSEPQVSVIIHEWTDTRPIAKRLLVKSAKDLAERVVKQANVAESIDVLERIEVIAPKKQADNGASRIAIVIGMPGQLAGPDPLIPLSPLPFALQLPEPAAVSD